MKKTYINPTMVVIKIETSHQMLAGSMGTNNLPDVNFSEATDDNTGYYAD